MLPPVHQRTQMGDILSWGGGQNRQGGSGQPPNDGAYRPLQNEMPIGGYMPRRESPAPEVSHPQQGDGSYGGGHQYRRVRGASAGPHGGSREGSLQPVIPAGLRRADLEV